MSKEVIVKEQTLLACLFFFAAGVAVSLFYHQAPTLGDDIGYWGLALDLHQGVPNAWNPDSFHDLRWPVWGLCWLLQFVFGYTSASYFLQPAVYLGAGAVLVYLLAREIGFSPAMRGMAGVLFLFHPLLDPSISRPMPDLSEGFWVAMAFYLWLRLMRSDSTKLSILLAALVGLSLEASQANRITGVFAVPVLVVATLVLYPRRFGWLLVCGLFTIAFVGIESAIYYAMTGDPLHSLTANLGAKGRKGTESIPVWQLPFRFLPALWRMPTDILFSSLACGGVLYIGARFGRPGWAVIAYAFLYYLTYNCALQSIFPPRPLVRDGDRFLASLAFPFALLVSGGLCLAGTILSGFKPFAAPLAAMRKHTFVSLVILTAFLMLISQRNRTPSEIYLGQFADYLEKVPAHTKVYSHDILRYVSYLASSKKAGEIDWQLTSHILQPRPEDLQALAGCDKVWLIRKHAWLRDRKHSETGRSDRIEKLAPYLTPPLAGWTIENSLLKGNVPDFLFLTRGDVRFTKWTPVPLGTLLQTWEFKKEFTQKMESLPVPAEVRGKQIFIGLRYASNTTEPVRLGVDFRDKAGAPLTSLLFKPYLFPETSPDFFAFSIPQNAETMAIWIRVSGKTKWIRLDAIDVTVQEEPAALFSSLPATSSPRQ